MLKLKPVNDHVLVLVDKFEKKSPGGLVIPNAKDDRPIVHGTVMEVGPGSKDDPQPYKRGDRVVINKHSGIDVDHTSDGKTTVTHRLIRAGEVLATIVEE